MLKNKIGNFIKSSLKGYRNLVFWSWMFLFFMLASAAAGMLLVYPLWLAATKTPVIFTILCSAIITAYFITILVRNLIKKSSRRLLFIRIKPVLIVSGKILFAALLLYPALLLFARGNWLPAVPLCVVVFFLIGNILYGKKINSRN